MAQTDEETLRLWREQCRRQINRPMSVRLKYGFVGSARRERVNRVFDTMADYRAWCEENLPVYFGYGQAEPPPQV